MLLLVRYDGEDEAVDEAWPSDDLEVLAPEEDVVAMAVEPPAEPDALPPKKRGRKEPTPAVEPAAVEPPKLQRSWTCMTAFWEYALASPMRPWAVEEFEKASRMLSEVVFLGGVGVKSARTALKKQLDFYSYAKDSDRHAVWLFCNRHEEWDGTVFDASLPKTTKDMVAFEGTNIHPVRLCDTTREAPWGEEELGTFYAVVDAVIRAIVSDKHVFVACYAGKNRSVAVKHAIVPWAYPRTKPGCDSMLRAAEGYRNNRDMSLVPLAPKMSKRKHGDGSGA